MEEDFELPTGDEMMMNNGDQLDLPDEGPMLKVGEEKEIGNQGLKKKLLKEGEGWDTPDNGDEVEGINRKRLSFDISFFSFFSLIYKFILFILDSSLHGDAFGRNSV